MCRSFERPATLDCFVYNFKIVRDDYFPENPRKSIIRSIYKFEKTFIESNSKQINPLNVDKSG